MIQLERVVGVSKISYEEHRRATLRQETGSDCLLRVLAAAPCHFPQGKGRRPAQAPFGTMHSETTGSQASTNIELGECNEQEQYSWQKPKALQTIDSTSGVGVRHPRIITCVRRGTYGMRPRNGLLTRYSFPSRPCLYKIDP